MARTKKLTKQEQFDNMLAQFAASCLTKKYAKPASIETFEVSPKGNAVNGGGRCQR